jgi:hypothetical protein
VFAASGTEDQDFHGYLPALATYQFGGMLKGYLSKVGVGSQTGVMEMDRCASPLYWGVLVVWDLLVRLAGAWQGG